MNRGWGRVGMAGLGLCVILACGGGGGDASSGAIPIGGVITTDNFVIPVGVVRIVNANLKVVASKSIRIEGTLQVPPAYDVDLYSNGPLDVSGEIQSPSTPGPSRRPLDLGGGMNLTGRTVTISNSVLLGEGQNLYASASGPGGTLTITCREIRAGFGRDAENSSEDGGRGGSVELGSANAQLYAQSHYGHSSATGFDNVSIAAETRVRAGSGGHGWDDTIGHQDGQDLRGQATSGGTGGDVTVFGKVSVHNDGTLKAGDGGDAGSIPDAFPGGRDGFNYLEAGQSVIGTSGNGGSGGSCLVLSPTKTGSGKAYRGHGMFGGSIDISAGTGGESGPGGDTSAYLGRQGAEGTGDDDGISPLPPTIKIYDSGNGGHGIATGRPGGRGGKISLRQVLSPNDEKCLVTIHNSGNGGDGASGCVYPPYRAGAPGGDAQAMVVSDLTAPDMVVSYSLYGGDGGSGSGPGPGGIGPSGNGRVGKSCSETALYVILDYAYGPFRAGDQIPYSWITNAHIGQPELPVTVAHGCAYYHIHADAGKGVYITDYSGETPVQYGPFDDPNPNHCGFGVVIAKGKQPEPGVAHSEPSPCCGQ